MLSGPLKPAPHLLGSRELFPDFCKRLTQWGEGLASSHLLCSRGPLNQRLWVTSAPLNVWFTRLTPWARPVRPLDPLWKTSTVKAPCCLLRAFAVKRREYCAQCSGLTGTRVHCLGAVLKQMRAQAQGDGLVSPGMTRVGLPSCFCHLGLRRPPACPEGKTQHTAAPHRGLLFQLL